MPALEWSDALALELPVMDETHREFVDLLAAVEAADADGRRAAWEALVAHTVAHFGAEDRWMRETGYAGGNCHAVQHHVVLQVMGEALKRHDEGDAAILPLMVGELAQWFPQHAQSMDAALALHLRSVGHDPATGAVARPQALPAEPITGCGGASCSPAAPVGEAVA